MKPLFRTTSTGEYPNRLKSDFLSVRVIISLGILSASMLSEAGVARLSTTDEQQPEIRISSPMPFTNNMEIYRRTDLLQGEWSLASHITPDTGSTKVTRIDANTDSAGVGFYCVADAVSTNTSGLTQIDIRTRARLLGYLYAEGACANPTHDGNKFSIGVRGAQNERALWCAQQMEEKGLLTIVSSTDTRIVLKDLPWEVPFAPVSWNTNIYMTFSEGLPHDPDHPAQWASEVYNSHFIAAIIEGEGSVGGLIDDQAGWGNYTPHITELCDLLNGPEYDCDAFMTASGKKVWISTNKFDVVRSFEFVATGRVPGGADGLVRASTPPEYHVYDNAAHAQITAPIHGSVISGNVEFSAEAEAPSGVAKAGFYVSGNWIISDQTIPYSRIYDTVQGAIDGKSPNGVHTVEVRITDGDGNTFWSDPITVTVANP
jgi:hypothetical protein